MEAKYQVCIIGGGLAGLAAASKLEEHKVSYSLFEASGRIGGRVYPYSYGNGTLQLGAEYINGTNNEMYRIAEKLGIVGEVEYDYNIYEKNPTFASGGISLDAKHFEIWKEFVDPLEDIIIEESKHSPQTSIGELFRSKYEEWVQEYEADKYIYDELAKTYISYFESEWSANIDTLAVANFHKWNDGFGSNTSFKLTGEGFGAVLREIISRVSLKNIHLNTLVTKIEWQARPVKIQLSSGRTVECENVIVCMPLGVLKTRPTLFEPRLPRAKQEAIRHLGFGNLEKIFLVYETAWWGEHVETIIPLRLDREENKEKPDTDDCFVESLRSFETVENQPKLLKVWLSGKGPRAIANLTEYDIKDKVTRFIRKIMNDSEIPIPTRVIMHKWRADPLIQGAYSYITPSACESLEDSYPDMANPIVFNDRPVLCFAGEHTHPILYQTTSGAYESGLREAIRIWDHIKDKEQT